MKIPDIELMLYSDGELDAERARRVRVARLCHPEVGIRLEGIARVGAFVRAWADEEGVDARAARRSALRGTERRRALGAVGVALVALAAVAEPMSASDRSEVALAPNPTVAIETVDFGEHAGTVFVVESSVGVTPVVWLVDDARAEG
jgi:hypothetical protein